MASHVSESDLSGVSDSEEERQDSWDLENERRMAGPPWEVHRSVESGKFWWSHPVSGPTATRPPMCEQYTPLPKPGAAGRWTVVDPGCNPFRGGAAKTQVPTEESDEEEEQDTRDTDGEVHVPESDEENDEESDRPDNPTTRYIDAVASNYRVGDMRTGLGTTRRKRLEKAKQICMGQMRRCRAEGDVQEETPFALELGAVYALIEELENPPGALYHTDRNKKRAAPDDDGEIPPAKQYRFKKRKPASDGSGAMPFIQGSKRAIYKDVNDKRPASTERQEPKEGYVPYRTDAVEHNSIGEGECVLEAFRPATGMTSFTRKSLGLPRQGDIDFKKVVGAVRKDSPFELRTVPPCKWSGLLALPKGIYLGRALLKDGNAHFVCYDAWRQIMFVGGAPPPPVEDAHDELERRTTVNHVRKAVKNVGRSFFIEEKEIADPNLFQCYMRTTFPVARCVDQLYSLHVQANRAIETEYNTPEHYVEERKRRFEKLAKKKEKEKRRRLAAAAAAEDAMPLAAVPAVEIM
jgi:hypothetical protein